MIATFEFPIGVNIVDEEDTNTCGGCPFLTSALSNKYRMMCYLFGVSIKEKKSEFAGFCGWLRCSECKRKYGMGNTEGDNA